MDKTAQLAGQLKNLSLNARQQTFITAKVVSVQGATCTVAVDSFEISDVRITPTLVKGENRIVLTPDVGSNVLLASQGGYSNLYVLAADAISKLEIVSGQTSIVADDQGIVFNGGDLGGMIKIEELTEKLNQMRGEFNAFVSVFNSHIHETTATVGIDAVGVIGTPSPNANNASEFKREDYENEKVKH